MSKRFIMRCIGLSLVAGNLIAFAATGEAQTPSRAVSPAFQAKLTALGPHLTQVEQGFARVHARINSKKAIQESDLNDEGFGRVGEAYGEAMKAAFEEAMKDAEAAGKSQGREGTVAHLQAFEALAKSHEARMKRLQKQADAMYSQMKSGAIKLDRPVLDKATPAQREEFHKFLTPAGRNQIQKLHPELFPKRSSLDFLEYAQLVMPDSLSLLFQKRPHDTLMEGFNACMTDIGSWIITPAEAATAAPCIAPCIARNWSACVVCVGGAGGAVINYWNNTFRPCWNNYAGKPWWTPGWLWRTWCLAKLVSFLA